MLIDLKFKFGLSYCLIFTSESLLDELELIVILNQEIREIIDVVLPIVLNGSLDVCISVVQYSKPHSYALYCLELPRRISFKEVNYFVEHLINIVHIFLNQDPSHIHVRAYLTAIDKAISWLENVAHAESYHVSINAACRPEPKEAMELRSEMFDRLLVHG